MNTFSPVMLEGTWPSHQPVWSWLQFHELVITIFVIRRETIPWWQTRQHALPLNIAPARCVQGDIRNRPELLRWYVPAAYHQQTVRKVRNVKPGKSCNGIRPRRTCHYAVHVDADVWKPSWRHNSLSLTTLIVSTTPHRQWLFPAWFTGGIPPSSGNLEHHPPEILTIRFLVFWDSVYVK